MSHLIVCWADHWSAPGSPDVSRCQILSCHSPHRLLAPVWCLLPWRGLKITKLAKLSSSKRPGPARHLFVLMAGVKTTVLAMKQAWLAFMSTSNKLEMTFNSWAVMYGIVLKSTLKCHVHLLNFSWNHLWPFLTHTNSSWVHLKTLDSLKYFLMSPM